MVMCVFVESSNCCDAKWRSLLAMLTMSGVLIQERKWKWQCWKLKTAERQVWHFKWYWLAKAHSHTITAQVWKAPAQGRLCSRDSSHRLIHYTVMSVVTSLGCREGIPTLYLTMHRVYFTPSLIHGSLAPHLSWIIVLNIAIYLQVSTLITRILHNLWN